MPKRNIPEVLCFVRLIIQDRLHLSDECQSPQQDIQDFDRHFSPLSGDHFIYRLGCDMNIGLSIYSLKILLIIQDFLRPWLSRQTTIAVQYCRHSQV